MKRGLLWGSLGLGLELGLGLGLGLGLVLGLGMGRGWGCAFFPRATCEGFSFSRLTAGAKMSFPRPSGHHPCNRKTMLRRDLGG